MFSPPRQPLVQQFEEAVTARIDKLREDIVERYSRALRDLQEENDSLRRRLDALEAHHDKPDYDSDGGVSPQLGIPPDDMPLESGEDRDRDRDVGSDGGVDDDDVELVTDLAE